MGSQVLAKGTWQPKQLFCFSLSTTANTHCNCPATCPAIQQLLALNNHQLTAKSISWAALKHKPCAELSHPSLKDFEALFLLSIYSKAIKNRVNPLWNISSLMLLTGISITTRIYLVNKLWMKQQQTRLILADPLPTYLQCLVQLILWKICNIENNCLQNPYRKLQRLQNCPAMQGMCIMIFAESEIH